MDELCLALKTDTKMVGLPVDFSLDIRGFSKRYNGRYDPNTKKIILYALDEDGRLIDYDELLDTTIHEAVHHYQWEHDPSFVRVKGVMHNDHFKTLERRCQKRARMLKSFCEGRC